MSTAENKILLHSPIVRSDITQRKDIRENMNRGRYIIHVVIVHVDSRREIGIGKHFQKLTNKFTREMLKEWQSSLP